MKSVGRLALSNWWHFISFYAGAKPLLNQWQYALLPAGVLLIALILELLLAGWKQSTVAQILSVRKTDVWDLMAAFFTLTGLQKFLSNFFFLGLIAFITIKMRDWAWPLFPAAPTWIRLLLALIIYDFFMYWNHRARHEIEWFWITHEFHHSASHLTLFTDFRVHPLDNLIFITTAIILMRIFFPTGILDLGGFVWIGIVPGFFGHCRIDTSLGFVGRYLIVTPRFHHVHHSRDGKKFKNYGHFLVIWDRLFGTYVEPVDSIHDIQVGLVQNRYESKPPLKAYLEPVMMFYAEPFRLLKNRIRLGSKSSLS